MPSTTPQNSPIDIWPYALALALGAFAGWMELVVNDVLFTAFLVLAPCMLMGFLRTARPWRWVALIGPCVPAAILLAYLLGKHPPRAQVFGSLLAFLPGIAGAYGGALMRSAVDNLLAGQ
jgi:hypothetical protein